MWPAWLIGTIVSQTGTPQSPSFEPFAQYGVVGTVAGLGLWFMWQAYKRERDRGDRLEKRLEEALVEVAAVSRETAPAVQRSNDLHIETKEVLKDVTDSLATLQNDMPELKSILKKRPRA